LINLNWSQPSARKILGLTLPQQSIDLDLGCLYEMKDGQKGCVQALGNSFGSLKNFPFIALDGDDRSGAASDGENLRVNGAHIAEFKRILIYTFIYEGVANWKSADGIVTVKCPGSEDLIVRMDEYSTSQRMCAIAMLENSNNQTFSVEKLIQFYDGHSKMDRAFSWGMNWVPGRKD
ncbi:MAG: tellurium resistance protein TerA, partial [Oscillospiraceae bacterium]|nr:tellurium resistance protein TerA [Oscillospiraceae bacterium]